ncbi:hypothetical protein [Chryseobacterium mucoviscidosis]|nr:hypothetical protein [Chryseobacterium mucoviscidosis]
MMKYDSYVKTIEEKANTKRKLIQEDYFFDFNKVTIDFFFKGLQFIKSDFLQNYVDLKHFMYLGGMEGFENEIDIHSSDTFQRALLNDCLLEIAHSFNLNLQVFIEKENQYIEGRQNKDNIGA